MMEIKRPGALYKLQVPVSHERQFEKTCIAANQERSQTGIDQLRHSVSDVDSSGCAGVTYTFWATSSPI